MFAEEKYIGQTMHSDVLSKINEQIYFISKSGFPLHLKIYWLRIRFFYAVIILEICNKDGVVCKK